MNLQSNDFQIFGLPERFALERSELDTRWKDLQRQAHPDRHASADAASQRLAMQWSVRINEAYQRLKDPLRRAAYLCELNGVSVQAEDNTAMPAEFLMQQMAWREALDEAEDMDALDALNDEVAAARARALSSFDWLLDEKGDYAGAVQQVRSLMFIERFARDVEARYERMER